MRRGEQSLDPLTTAAEIAKRLLTRRGVLVCLFVVGLLIWARYHGKQINGEKSVFKIGRLRLVRES